VRSTAIGFNIATRAGGKAARGRQFARRNSEKQEKIDERN